VRIIFDGVLYSKFYGTFDERFTYVHYNVINRWVWYQLILVDQLS